MIRDRVLLALVAIFPTAALHAQPAPERAPGWTARQAAHASREMIVAAHPLAADAGALMLTRGGSAVDAAIAAQLVLGLVEPQSSGLGGGGFMLVHDAGKGRAFAYDGREVAPQKARSDRFLDAAGQPLRFADAVIGGMSVGVPGAVALLEHAHRRHGRLAWSKLFEPAIALAEQGFSVSPRLATMIGTETLMKQSRALAYFGKNASEPLRAGTLLRNPAYARTLRTLAANGATAFYRGDIARDIVATVANAAAPGDLSLDDLASYRVIERDPVCGAYRSYRVCGMPLPSSGGITVLQILNLLAPFDLEAMGPASFWSVHFMSEAGRLAYADRGAYMADPAFAPPPFDLLDAAYLRDRAALIKATSTLGRASAGTVATIGDRAEEERAIATHEGLEFSSTTHLSVIDRYGNAVAFTSTIEDGFGSRLFTEGGFLLNNQLTDFSFRPEEDGKRVANRVEPGKRPRSSMAPTIVYDRAGRIAIVAGSPGGSTIINYVVKALIGVIDWKLDAQAALALPNFGSRNGPTELEGGTLLEALAPKLTALGHEVRVIEQRSGSHMIVRTPQGLVGGADPRREGEARGR
ncbi:MAG TPA: gamma-glutamyltransferase [Casimicrobiaceae bacterium]|nr:gamma-glutamyltransferase [Casimicrobiaceae bacterium]